MNVEKLLEYINKNHECKHLFWRKHRGQDIDDLFKLQKKYDNTNLYFNIIRKDGLRDCLFFDFDDKEEPEKAISEAKDFYEFLKEKGLSPYMQESGNKGAHVILWHEPFYLKNYRAYMERVVAGHGYETVDHAVFNNGLRLCRIPLSINPKSSNPCKPLTNNIVFNYELEEHFKEADKVFEEEILRKTIRVKREYNDKLDALALINHYNIDVKNDLGDRYIVYCPFHSDKNPSAVLWKEGVFHCSTCNISLTAYQFVAMKENLNPEDKYEVGQKIKEVLNG